MGVFSISDVSGATDNLCQVSKYTHASGTDDWFVVKTTPQRWVRDGWELVAFKNAADTERRGWYIRVSSDQTCTIKFFGFSRDLGLEYS